MTDKPSMLDEAAPTPLSSAQDFRLLMEAMARPGKVVELAPSKVTTKLFNQASRLCALALCDHEVSIWLDAGLAQPQVIEFLNFHTGSNIVQDLATADFVFFSAMPSLEELNSLQIGTPQYPDRSATVILEMANISAGDGYVLSGPGIQDKHYIDVDGLSQEFIQWWPENRARFPLGIDVYLTSDSALVGLPRTTTIEENS